MINYLPSLLFLSTTGSSSLMSPCFLTASALFGFSTGILFSTLVHSPHLSQNINSILSKKASVKIQVCFFYLILNYIKWFGINAGEGIRTLASPKAHWLTCSFSAPFAQSFLDLEASALTTPPPRQVREKGVFV